MAERERVDVSRSIKVPPSVVFSIVTDPAMHVAIDGSGMLVSPGGASSVAAVGDRFVMHMDREPLGDIPLGKYDVENVVTRFDADQVFEWGIGQVGSDTTFGHVYGYELSPAGDGVTEVTHYCDWTGVPDEHKTRLTWPVVPVHMLERTIDNLVRVAEEQAGQ